MIHFKQFRRAMLNLKSVDFRTAVALCAILAQSIRPVAAQSNFPNKQIFFGPLACALSSAYGKWLSGPLKNAKPSAASFTTSLNANSDPYIVSFSPTSGSTISGGSYSIAASSCFESSLPAVPASSTAPKGPLTLSGSYSFAVMSAKALHQQLSTASGTDVPAYFADTNAPGGGVVVASLYGSSVKIIVGFYQAVPAGSSRNIGCYKEQHYFVNASTYSATSTSAGCAG